MNKFEQIEKQIENLQIEYIENIITEIWYKDLEDYWIEILTPWFIEFWDYYTSFTDFEWVAKYKMPEAIFYEYHDWLSLTFESERCREFQETLPDDLLKWTLYLFYAFCMQDDEERKRYKAEDLKRSQEKVEEARNLLFETLKWN